MSNATAAAAPRRRSDGWRWTGRVYLVVLLAFAILIVILLFKPAGLLGKFTVEKV